jgi:hypothetical protein
LQPLDGRPPYPYADEELRQAARDAFVHWQGSRYSVPWIYAGKPLWVREQVGRVEVRHGAECIADHPLARRQHLVVIEPQHHGGIPLGARQVRKTLVHLHGAAPVVEVRPLAAYESLVAGGARRPSSSGFRNRFVRWR